MTVRTRKSADERKAEIVDAAIRLAGDIGPDRLTTEMLAKEVGISQPGIFRHFPTKGEIWWAVAQRIGGMMGRTVEQGESEEANPGNQLRRLVINQLRFIETTPAIPAILFSRELHAENEKMRAFFAGLKAGRQRRFSK
ncbi:MAG: TetR/AcrR family transcriptional regulator, partial [Rhodospirillales bacterium]|nr:TetR/AcrR family transcriptional regulator [Rhodospirillales bacterium]